MKKKLNCVLLIDDDDASNFLNRMVFDYAKITNHLETALNGKEALDYLTNAETPGGSPPCPDLILLDINMPVMDGWEFLDAYHKLEDHQKSKVVIVMLTTSLNPYDQKRAAKIAEISGFKNKPLTVEMLNDIVKAYFPDYL